MLLNSDTFETWFQDLQRLPLFRVDRNEVPQFVNFITSFMYSIISNVLKYVFPKKKSISYGKIKLKQRPISIVGFFRDWAQVDIAHNFQDYFTDAGPLFTKR